MAVISEALLCDCAARGFPRDARGKHTDVRRPRLNNTSRHQAMTSARDNRKLLFRSIQAKQDKLVAQRRDRKTRQKLRHEKYRG